MGSTKKASSEKKKEEALASAAAAGAKHQGVVSGKASKKNEIDAIFGKKKRKSAIENQEALPEGDGVGSRPSSQKKKRVRKSTPSVDEDGKGKAGKQSGGCGKAGKSSSSAEPGLSKSRKKTADGLTLYGEDELKWNNKDAGGTPLCPFDCECCF